MVAARDLRELSADELQTRLGDMREQLFKLRFQQSTGQLENSARLRTLRRDIARVMTVLREHELGLEVGPDDTAAKA
jgi:large subunit ribosomal protein L29